jgi:hypothetical protein
MAITETTQLSKMAPRSGCERGVVEELRGPARAELHEALKSHEVADVADRAHVTLDVSRHVRAEPVARVELLIEDPWVAAGARMADFDTREPPHNVPDLWEPFDARLHAGPARRRVS